MDSLQTPSEPVPLMAGAMFDAWRHISRAQWIAAFLFGAAVFLMHMLVWGRQVYAPSPRGLASPLLQQLVLDGIGALALMLALVVADRATGADARRRGSYVLAAAIGAAAGAILDSLALNVFWSRFELVFTDPSLDPTSGFMTYRSGHLFYLFFEWLTLGGLATFVYVDRRRAQAHVARWHGEEMARAQTAKRVLESRLQAMQARVEPQFLFNTLAQVKRLYETDPVIAERMLDDLIAYLRAAMPRMRDTTSTLAQEIELVRAYLDIVKVRLGNRLAVEIQVPGNAGSVRMPPMMLLPLIDHAIAHGLGPAHASGAIRIDCTIDAGRLRLLIADSGAGFVPEAGGDGIASIRERLSALYGDDASLEMKRGEAESTNAVMVIPFEALARIDDEADDPARRNHDHSETP